MHVEAAIDFADEPLDTLGGAALRARFDALAGDLDELLRAAERGRRLRDGLHAVIVGPPNAGKSSLLNALAGSDRAIVTDIAGTTRDLLHEVVRIDGVELTLVDTAGLREGGDAIEREGMRRARDELDRADLAIVVLDARDPDAGRAAVADAIAGVAARLWLHNKADLLEAPRRRRQPDAGDDRCMCRPAPAPASTPCTRACAQLAQGDAADAGEGAFTARARHVDALLRARDELDDARVQLDHELLDLAAEVPAPRPRCARRDHRPGPRRRPARADLLELLHRQVDGTRPSWRPAASALDTPRLNRRDAGHVFQ